MKLYGLTLSPYVARVRLALQFKGLDCRLEPPPGGGSRSAEYLAINPIGKVPSLVTDDGLTIAESETIIDYLDETVPEPSLTPGGTEARARMRNAIRCLELYVTPAMSRLFGQMNSAIRNAQIVDGELAQVRSGLALLEKFVDPRPYAVHGRPSKADCIVLPSLLLTGVVCEIFAQDDLLGQCPGLMSYRRQAREEAVVGRIWDETADALARFRAGG